MNDPAANLDLLHDLVLPPTGPWWPPAPAWYLIIAIVAAFAMLLTHRAWRGWHANAYRRAALRELALAEDVTTISEILRRTALAIAPRAEIAGTSGAAWLDWLTTHASVPMPSDIRSQLTAAIYGPLETDADLSAVRTYARGWIANHRTSPC